MINIKNKFVQVLLGVFLFATLSLSAHAVIPMCNKVLAYGKGITDGKRGRTANSSMFQNCSSDVRASIMDSYKRGYVRGRKLANVNNSPRFDPGARHSNPTPYFCTTNKIYQLGFNDGKKGDYRANRTAGKCPQAMRRSLLKSYVRGYTRGYKQSGATNYCTTKRIYSKGYSDGKLNRNRGRELINNCPIDLQRQLEHYYQRGFALGRKMAARKQYCSSANFYKAGQRDAGYRSNRLANMLLRCPNYQLKSLIRSYLRGKQER